MGRPFFILSLGLYQAYIQVAIFVYIIIFIRDLLMGRDLKESILSLVYDAFTIVISTIIYYAVYRLILILFHLQEGNRYNSLSIVNSSIFSSWKERIKNIVNSEIGWFLYPNANNQTLVFILNVFYY